MASWKTRLFAPSNWIVLIGLAGCVFLIYYPIVSGGFLADDNVYIAHLLEHARNYVQGEKLGDWVFGFNGIAFLRPVVQWLWLSNFIAWERGASGYYAINILLHALSAFLVYLLTWQIVRNRFGAVAAGLLFALHPIHAESVSWIADCVDLLAAFFSLLSAVFFVLYRKNGKRLNLVTSLAAFALAGLTKESALTLPVSLLAYDVLFNFGKLRWKIAKGQLPFWLMLPAYFTFRILLFHGFGGNPGLGFINYGTDLFFQYYTLSLLKPFLEDMNGQLLVIILGLAVLLMIAFRRCKGMWIGLVWLASSFVPAGFVYVAPRLVYIPSVGLALATAAILAHMGGWQKIIPRVVALTLFLGISAAYAWSLSARVGDWASAGTIATVIPAQLKRLYPSIPADSNLYFIGIPEVQRGVYVYSGNFAFAIRNAYFQKPYFQAYSWAKFPIVIDGLEHSYFFEYRRRNVIERQDISKALAERKQCSEFSSPVLMWDFSRDSQGWEAWSQLKDFAFIDGALVTQSGGDNPSMGSPVTDIPSIAIGDIQVTMRAHADRPGMQGALYWLVAGMEDFSPALRVSFPVNADEAFHRYQLSIEKTGQLMFGDRIVRLRLDPINGPGEIAIQSIEVSRHCNSMQTDKCSCP